MPRLVYLTGLALLLLAGAFLLTDRLVRPPGITEANVKRIRPGMTLAQVERLLGGPATENETFWGKNSSRPGGVDAWHRRSWAGPEGTALVFFNGDDGAVARAEFGPGP